DQTEELRRLNQRIERGVVGPERPDALDHGLVADAARLIARVTRLERRKLLQQRRRRLRRQEVLDDHVPERLGRGKAFGQRGSALVEIGVQHRRCARVGRGLIDYSASAASTTLSTVKPKYSNSLSAGAEAPKRSMPITAPSRPTYLRQ